jgi:hypothetical protein
VLVSVLGLTAVPSRRAVGALAAHRNRFRLAPEPRPATDAEPLLQSLVFLPILQRCPNEQATDKNGGQEDEEDKNDPSGTIHIGKSFPPKPISGPTNVPPGGVRAEAAKTSGRRSTNECVRGSPDDCARVNLPASLDPDPVV